MFRATGGTSYIRAVLPNPVNVESESFTLACYMQVDSYVNGIGWTLYSTTGASSYEYAGTLTYATPELRLRIRDGVRILAISDLTPPAVGTIFPLVVTYDAALDAGEIFVNGVSAGAGSLALAAAGKDTLAVGVVHAGDGLAAKGELRVAHARAWRRVLTAQEISDYSNATSKADIDAISSVNLLSSADLISDATVNSGPAFTETGAVYDGVDPLAAPVVPTITTTLVADSADTALPASVTTNVRVFTTTNVLVGIGTITVPTSGAVAITDADLTLETGQSITDATVYRVDFQEAAGPRQRTVEITAAAV